MYSLLQLNRLSALIFFFFSFSSSIQKASLFPSSSQSHVLLESALIVSNSSKSCFIFNLINKSQGFMKVNLSTGYLCHYFMCISISSLSGGQFFSSFSSTSLARGHYSSPCAVSAIVVITSSSSPRHRFSSNIIVVTPSTS